MIKKILVGIGSDPASDIALMYAGKLGEKLGAVVSAMHVVQKEPFPSSWPVKKLVEKEIEEERQRVAKLINEFIKKDRLPDIQFKKLVEGDPSGYLITEAEKGGYDLIVIGHRNIANIKKLFLGSVSSKVVQYAKVSVLVTKQLIGPSKALFCFDGSKCAEESLRFGGEIIKNMNCKALVLNISPWIKNESETLANEIVQEGAEILKELGVDASAKAIFSKEIAKEILKEADEGNFDLIVVGSRGFSGIHRFLIGSTTLKLINQTRLPILVYKRFHKSK
jgi:nucleotide-binding universal stress UspA family protein